jgi:deazaflavin-dependent oxidoreductase (nitroreductase family)
MSTSLRDEGRGERTRSQPVDSAKPGPPSSGRFDGRAMNDQMVQRLLTGTVAPLPPDGYVLRVLEVAGRETREPRRTPVGLVDHAGAQYLVCPDRRRDWPNNLIAAGRCRMLAGEQRTEYTVTEVTGQEAAEVVSAYLTVVTVPWARSAFGVPPDASVSEIQTHLDRMAVFRLSPHAG